MTCIILFKYTLFGHSYTFLDMLDSVALFISIFVFFNWGQYAQLYLSKCGCQIWIGLFTPILHPYKKLLDNWILFVFRYGSNKILCVGKV